MLRAFVALELAPDLVSTVRGVQARLRRAWPTLPLGWSTPAQWHLTLRFLGSIAETAVRPLCDRLAAACRTRPAFTLTLGDPGAFPDSRRARVIWLGWNGDLERLNDLAAAVQAASRGFGDHVEERAFHAHLTLARLRGRDARACRLEAHLLALDSPLARPAWPVTEVHLIRSVLEPQGARYTRLATFPLALAPVESLSP